MDMHDIIGAIMDADDARWRTQEKIAEALGCSSYDPVFRSLISAMLVSGYIHLTGRALAEGPNVLRNAPIQPRFAGPPRRPQADTPPVEDDKLRIAGRIPLADGETPAGSASINDKERNPACVAAVMTPTGPTVRISAPIIHDSKSDWCAADDDGTVVLDAAGAQAFDDAVEKVIADANVAKAEYRARERVMDKARDEFMEQEKRRFDEDTADAKVDADWMVNTDEKYQRDRQAWLDNHVKELDPQRRAAYDELEAEYRKHLDVHGTDEDLRRAQEDRRAIRARQADLVTDLDEAQTNRLIALIQDLESGPGYRELQDIRRKVDDLFSAAGTWRFSSGENHWLNAMLTHDSAQAELDKHRAAVDELERMARPVDEQTAADIAAAKARYQAAEQAYEDLAGLPITTVEVPGQWGTVVVQAVQGEEGGDHRFLVDVRPANAHDNWAPGDNDGWRPTVGKLRELARTVRQMRDAATPAGYRPGPAGVFPGSQGDRHAR